MYHNIDDNKFNLHGSLAESSSAKILSIVVVTDAQIVKLYNVQ